MTPFRLLSLAAPNGYTEEADGSFLLLGAALMQDQGLSPPPPVTGLWRALYVFLGLFFVFLGAVGVVTPVLPTTPFLLLAGYFFARSSPRLHAWLLRSHVFGPLIRDWQRHRAVRPKVKVTALVLVPLVIASSAYFGSLPWYLVVMLVGLGLIGLTVVIRLPVIRDEPAAQPMVCGDRLARNPKDG